MRLEGMTVCSKGTQKCCRGGKRLGNELEVRWHMNLRYLGQGGLDLPDLMRDQERRTSPE